jgi:Ca2+-binding EF-hand superfamily protein
MEAAFRLPIKPSDIEAFVEIWKKYDPSAEGFIKTQDFGTFLKELAKSETNFFSYNHDQMTSEEYREEYIKNLEIPCHKNF